MQYSDGENSKGSSLEMPLILSLRWRGKWETTGALGVTSVVVQAKAARSVLPWPHHSKPDKTLCIILFLREMLNFLVTFTDSTTHCPRLLSYLRAPFCCDSSMPRSSPSNHANLSNFRSSVIRASRFGRRPRKSCRKSNSSSLLPFSSTTLRYRRPCERFVGYFVKTAWNMSLE